VTGGRNSLQRLLRAGSVLDAQIEMVRMCVAEVGYDPDLIRPLDSDGFFFIVEGGAIPSAICWRARELVGLGDPKCFRCADRDMWGLVVRCLATERFTPDCGVVVDHQPAQS
jgi:hypothetical protein